MSKDSKTGQRTHRQPTPTKIILERHYVGTEKIDIVFKRIAEEQITKKVKEIAHKGLAPSVLPSASAVAYAVFAKFSAGDFGKKSAGTQFNFS